MELLLSLCFLIFVILFVYRKMGCGPSKESEIEVEVRNETSSGTKAHAKGKPKTFKEAYTLGEVLGEGAFSVVKLATNKQTKQKVAVKIIHKSGLSQEDELSLKQVRCIIMCICE